MAVTTSESVTPSTVNGAPVEKAPEPVVAEPKEVAKDLVEIELFHQFSNNYSVPEAEALGLKHDGVGRVFYGPGKVKVDRDTADDLLRRQQAVLKSENDRMNGTDRTSGQLANLG
jgi:hypothetical protein